MRALCCYSAGHCPRWRNRPRFRRPNDNCSGTPTTNDDKSSASASMSRSAPAPAPPAAGWTNLHLSPNAQPRGVPTYAHTLRPLALRNVDGAGAEAGAAAAVGDGATAPAAGAAGPCANVHVSPRLHPVGVPKNRQGTSVWRVAGGFPWPFLLRRGNNTAACEGETQRRARRNQGRTHFGRG